MTLPNQAPSEAPFLGPGFARIDVVKDPAVDDAEACRQADIGDLGARGVRCHTSLDIGTRGAEACELHLMRMRAFLGISDASEAFREWEQLGQHAQDAGARANWIYHFWGVIRPLWEGRLTHAKRALSAQVSAARALFQEIPTVWSSLLLAEIDFAMDRPLSNAQLSALRSALAEEPTALPWLVRLEARLGNEVAARGLLQEALGAYEALRPEDRLLGDRLSGCAVLAEVAATVTDLDAADRLYDWLKPHPEAVAVDSMGLPPLAISEVLGRLALCRGQHWEAAQHLDDAVSRYRNMGMKPQLAVAEAELAIVLKETDETAGLRAEQLIEHAENLAESLEGPRVKADIKSARARLAQPQQHKPSGVLRSPGSPRQNSGFSQREDSQEFMLN